MGSSILAQKETQSIIFLAYYSGNLPLFTERFSILGRIDRNLIPKIYFLSPARFALPLPFELLNIPSRAAARLAVPHRSRSIHCLWEHSYLQLSCSSRSDSSRMSTGANDLCSVLRTAINEYTTRPSILKGYSEKSLLQS